MGHRLFGFCVVKLWSERIRDQAIPTADGLGTGRRQCLDGRVYSLGAKSSILDSTQWDVTSMNRTKGESTNHPLFFDTLRNVTMLFVVLCHAVAAYSTVTPYWPVHNGHSVIAYLLRQSKGAGPFLRGKFKRLGIPWLASHSHHRPNLTIYWADEGGRESVSSARYEKR